jgi:hypothetical protein
MGGCQAVWRCPTREPLLIEAQNLPRLAQKWAKKIHRTIAACLQRIAENGITPADLPRGVSRDRLRSLTSGRKFRLAAATSPRPSKVPWGCPLKVEPSTASTLLFSPQRFHVVSGLPQAHAGSLLLHGFRGTAQLRGHLGSGMSRKKPTKLLEVVLGPYPFCQRLTGHLACLLSCSPERRHRATRWNIGWVNEFTFPGDRNSRRPFLAFTTFRTGRQSGLFSQIRRNVGGSVTSRFRTRLIHPMMSHRIHVYRPDQAPSP